MTASPTAPADPTTVVVGLRSDYLTGPLAVPTTRPWLTWHLESSRNDVVQSAFDVLVTAERAGTTVDLWRSGPVESRRTGVAYGGTALAHGDWCTWRVRARIPGGWTDWSEAAQFGVGPTARSDWAARWITDRSVPGPSIAAHHGFRTTLPSTPDEPGWVRVHLARPTEVSGVTLHPTRPYVRHAAPGYLFPSTVVVYDGGGTELGCVEDVAPVRTQSLHIPIDVAVLDTIEVRVAADRDSDDPGFALAGLVIEGPGGEIDVAEARVDVSSSLESDDGWSVEHLLTDDRISHPAGIVAQLPALRASVEFDLEQVPERAVVHTSALGICDLRVNGTRIGPRLAPGWTDYRSRLHYVSEEITSLLRQGSNVVDGLVGDGWYAGRLGMTQEYGSGLRYVYGDRTALLAQIEAWSGGHHEIVLGTSADWAADRSGPVRENDLFDGEHLDATFDSARPVDPAIALDHDVWPTPSNAEPIAQLAEFPGRIDVGPDGVPVVDFGQNLAGTVAWRFGFDRLSSVRIKHGECLDEDGNVYFESLRGATQEDSIVADRPVEWEPALTTHGFRYARLDGVHPDQIDAAVAHALSTDSPQTGWFDCSDPFLNRLWSAIYWTQRSNIVGVAQDCPQRDERLGWQGDLQIFCRTASWNADMAGFFRKNCADQRDGQDPNGRFADFVPHVFRPDLWRGAPAWCDSGVIVPWTSYMFYGDSILLEQQFEAACRWVDYVAATNPERLWLRDRGNDYGDWLNSDTFDGIDIGVPGEVDKVLVSTAFHHRSATIVARMATVLGDDDRRQQYERLAREIRSAFNARFVERDGRLTDSTQAAHAVALAFRLIPDELVARVQDGLVAAVERAGGRMTTGIQVTHLLLDELSRAGRSDLAYAMIQSDHIPSWRHMIDSGATTIWERWDGWVPGRGFATPAMNSFNHMALGSVGEWLYEHVLGLEPTEPGFRVFRVAPQPGGGLTRATGAYESVAGRIEVAWTHDDGRFELEVAVPANTTATIVMPGSSGTVESVGSGHHRRRSQLSPAPVLER